MTKEERQKYAVELYQNGMGVTRISQNIGVSSTTVKNYLKAAGVSIARAPINLTLLKMLHAEGLHDSELARRLNCSTHTVKRYREQLGLAANVYDHLSTNLTPILLDENAAMVLYKLGLSDWEAGKELGISVNTFRIWRKCHELEPNKHSKITSATNTLMLSLYKAGRNDNEISMELEISEGAVRMWRNKNHLKPNYTPIDEDEIMNLYKQGLTDGEIGRRVDRTPNAIFLWRQKRKLPPNVAKGQFRAVRPKHFTAEAVKELYEQGKTDREIAEALNCTVRTAGNRRRELGLKPNKKTKNKEICNTTVLQVSLNHMAGFSLVR